jgi:hypothetical protein
LEKIKASSKGVYDPDLATLGEEGNSLAEDEGSRVDGTPLKTGHVTKRGNKNEKTPTKASGRHRKRKSNVGNTGSITKKAKVIPEVEVDNSAEEKAAEGYEDMVLG